MDEKGKEAEIRALGQELERLHRLYEHYFLGIEKLEPASMREQVKRKIQALKGDDLKRAHLRFMMDSLSSKFNTFQTYWNRVLIQREQGTYSRDRFKLKLKEARRQEADLDKPIPPPAAPPPDNGLEERIRQLHRTFVEARRRTKEPTNVDLDSVSRMIRGQLPELERKYGSNVDFKVVIANGKARIKAVRKA